MGRRAHHMTLTKKSALEIDCTISFAFPAATALKSDIANDYAGYGIK